MNPLFEKLDLENRPFWLVGGSAGGANKIQEFLDKGIWYQNHDKKKSAKYVERMHAYAREMKTGDGIVLKTQANRKHGLNFENNQQFVSIMKIYAAGIIKESINNGESFRVEWQIYDPPREWYFFTYITPLSQLWPKDSPFVKALADFAFKESEQDIAWFLEYPFWGNRYNPDKEKQLYQAFPWVPYYEEAATALLRHRKDRSKLVSFINQIENNPELLTTLNDRYEKEGPHQDIKDIDPFTVFGTFNRSMSDENRLKVFQAFAHFLEVSPFDTPNFTALPTMNNQSSWFMPYAFERPENHNDDLWALLQEAIELDEKEDTTVFEEVFNRARVVKHVGWKLTIGLFWVRPRSFFPLDPASRTYIEKTLGIPIPKSQNDRHITAEDYLQLRVELLELFESEDAPVHSFLELSMKAYEENSTSPPVEVEEDDNGENNEIPLLKSPDKALSGFSQEESYSLEDILKDGSFLSLEELEQIKTRLLEKKNLILQGPPGTGKTWLARRMAWALMGKKSPQQLHALHFHPNLSYEDFVRGYRPSPNEKLEVVDGPFMTAIQKALEAPDEVHVVLIEEFNRGNPAQIFGEMLTLIENTKRQEEHAIRLTYGDASPVYVPENLYVIATMNIADRSLALVDFALRRRFAFIDMYPQLNERWTSWMVENTNFGEAFIKDIQTRLQALNQRLSSATGLGRQFQVGHSYLTPHEGAGIKDPVSWFCQVVETEIGPLLEEYWFDSPHIAEEERQKLLDGLEW